MSQYLEFLRYICIIVGTGFAKKWLSGSFLFKKKSSENPEFSASPMDVCLTLHDQKGAFANRADPGQMPHFVASDLGLHC